MGNPLDELDITPDEWEHGRTWYTHAADRIDCIARKYDVEPVIARAVFAAVSPGMRLEDNYNWLTAILAGLPRGVKPVNVSLPYGWAPIALGYEILRVNGPDLLTGPKRIAFYRNLMGDESKVTLDTWALKPFGLKRAPKSQQQRQVITDAYTDFAKRHGVTPAAAQAAVWVHLRGKDKAHS